jgi:hypothetical protein
MCIVSQYVFARVVGIFEKEKKIIHWHGWATDTLNPKSDSLRL